MSRFSRMPLRRDGRRSRRHRIRTGQAAHAAPLKPPGHQERPCTAVRSQSAVNLGNGNATVEAVYLVGVVAFPLAATPAGAAPAVRNVIAAEGRLGLAADALGHV